MLWLLFDVDFVILVALVDFVSPVADARDSVVPKDAVDVDADADEDPEMTVA